MKKTKYDGMSIWDFKTRIARISRGLSPEGPPPPKDLYPPNIMKIMRPKK